MQQHRKTGDNNILNQISYYDISYDKEALLIISFQLLIVLSRTSMIDSSSGKKRAREIIRNFIIFEIRWAATTGYFECIYSSAAAWLCRGASVVANFAQRENTRAAAHDHDHVRAFVVKTTAHRTTHILLL